MSLSEASVSSSSRCPFQTTDPHTKEYVCRCPKEMFSFKWVSQILLCSSWAQDMIAFSSFWIFHAGRQPSMWKPGQLWLER